MKRRIQALIGGDEHSHTELAAGPFYIAHRTYDRAFEQSWHEHGQATIDLILDGGGVGTYGNRSVESVPGRVEFFRHELRHRFRAGTDGIRSLHISIPGPMIERSGATRDVCVRSLEHSDALRLTLSLYREIMAEHDCSTPLAVESIAFELLGEVSRAEAVSRVRAGFLGDVRDALHATLDRPLGLSELAALAGVNRGHLARTFKARIGMSIGMYHRRLRCQESVRRIMRGGDSIARVAQETGFSDQAHLTRAMRAQLGITPGALRRETGHAG